MIIKQIIAIILLVFCIYCFNNIKRVLNDIKYQVQVRYFTKKHERKRGNREERTFE